MKKYLEKQHYRLFLIVMFLCLSTSMKSEGLDSLNTKTSADSFGYPPNSLQLIPALNFKNTDIRDILRGLALEYKTNIVVDNGINQPVSVALFRISVFDAVKIIAEDNGYEFSYNEQRFFVNKPKPEPPPLPDEPEITYYKTDRKLDISASNVDIDDFVRKLRDETGYNYLLTKGTTGKISGTLKLVDFGTGLRNIFRNNGFYFIEKDSIYYISRSAYFSEGNSENGEDHGFYWVSLQDSLVTLDVTNANVNKILDDIINQLNIQLIKLDEPNYPITIKCSSIPIEQALYYLFKGSDYTFKKENSTYIIGAKKTRDLASVKLIKLKHLRADKLLEQISNKSFNAVSIQPVIEHNGLLLYGPQESIMALEEYIDVIDQPVPQVMIEAVVVDYNLGKVFQAGLTAGTGDSSAASRSDQWFPGLDVTASGNKINNLLDDIGDFDLFGQNIDLGKVSLPKNFYANLKFLETNNIADVKSRPILSTLNGHTASLELGSIQNYVVNQVSSTTTSFVSNESIQSIEANITFEITPWVGPDNVLTVELKPKFETPVGSFSPDKNEIPTINTRSLESTIRLRDGETIVIGGLIEETETNVESKFPILGDIPFIGKFFTSTSKQKGKSELMIYVTPRIFYGDDFGYASYEDFK